MIAGARRRGTETFPLPVSGTGNTHPTYDGSGIIIHPSVVDMGARWNGYRWWRADTPFPSDIHENPSIWGSNDRTTWEVPSGLTNPIDPWPGELTGRGDWFNSDTEMVWDADSNRLVVYWREAGHGALDGGKWWAASSGDGRTWVHHGKCFDTGMSNTIARDPETGVWRMYAFGQPATSYLANNILGPWTPGPAVTGWQDPSSVHAYHGDVIPYQGVWIAMWSANVPQAWVAASPDGYTWYRSAGSVANGYRFTLCPSTEPGYIDVWQSAGSSYHRIADSTWLDLLP